MARSGRKRKARASDDGGIDVYGVHAVEELLRQGRARVERVALRDASAPQYTTIVALAAARGLVPVELDARALGAHLAQANHQGVVARCAPPAYADFGALCEGWARAARVRVALLDEVQDPGNLGAILRAAAAFGIEALIVPKRRAAGLSPGTIRASSGYAWAVPVAQVHNVAQAIERLREAGVWVLGTVVEGGQALSALELPGDKIALVLGGEHRGLRRLTRERCDLEVTLTEAAGVESLNVGAAAAVCFYELARRGNEARGPGSLEVHDG